MDQYIWVPGDTVIRKMLGMTIVLEVTAEDIRENGVGKMLKKPIERAAARIYGKSDTWGAYTGLWFGWRDESGERIQWEYRCTEEAFKDFASNPRPCGIRFVRVK